MRRIVVAAVCAVVFTTLLFAAPQKRIAIRNWTIPSLKLGPNAAISGRASFVAVDPCRIVDTRNPNGSFGGPKLQGGTSRSFVIPNGPCAGIPVAAAYSLNLTVNLPESNDGFLIAYPTGNARPVVAALNFNMNETKGNAAIVPADGAGSIDIYSNVTTHLIMDINGYFIEPVITGVTAGTGLTGGGASGNVTLGINTSGATSGQALSYNGTTTTWSNVINGVTAGTGLSGGGTSGTVSLNVNFAGSGSANTAARSDHSHYARTVIVNSGGSATANGTALLNALAGITTASATNPFLLKIEPGIYDLVNTSLNMKPYVDIEGSGELATTIRRNVGPSGTPAVVFGADSAELRFLTLESSGGSGSVAMAFYSTGVSPRLLHVTLRASGGSTNAYGAYSYQGSPSYTFVTVTATGGTNGALGIVTDSADATLTHVQATASSASAAFNNAGLYVVSAPGSHSAVINDAIGSASGGFRASGVYVYDINVTLRRVTASGSGGTSNYGVYIDNPSAAAHTVTIDFSKLTGSTATLRNQSGFTTNIGASQLDGGNVAIVGGSVTCYAVYDENYTNLLGLTSCP